MNTAPPGTPEVGLALEARGLGKRFGPIPALDGVDLAVPAGQFVLLLGPNGAGKSTLLRLFATLLRPGAGTLRVLGEDVGNGDRAAIRRRIGLLSHQTFLYDHLTGEENLTFYARLYGLADPPAAAREALRAARLEGRGSDQVRTYSRGMQQRLAIARALLHRPDVLLLDEPFTGLDRDAALRLEERLREERSARRTCVLATHDFRAALGVADRVIVLVDGRLAADRPAAGSDPGSLEALFSTATRAGAPAAGAA
ncbi:MAG: ABC transporter ATP-binding protein [Acidobacteria bacterium]|nr:ABC transporter ATP-binding protein [Acidobacteriota bacterium]